MADQKIQLILEALDKTKEAFSSLDTSIKGLDTETKKSSTNISSYMATIKESWMGLSAAAFAVQQAIQKTMEYVELGAKAMQAEAAFDNITKSLNVNKEQWLQATAEASAGAVDESHRMQKALKAMAQDIDPQKIPALFDAARVGAVKSGEDITNVADGIIDAVANQMPKGLRRFGLVTKEELGFFNKAVAAGAENLNLLELALNNSKIQAAKMGVESNNAAVAVQKFKVQVEELKETLGKLAIEGLQKSNSLLTLMSNNYLRAASSGAKLLEIMSAISANVFEKTGQFERAEVMRKEEERYARYAKFLIGAANLQDFPINQTKSQTDLDAEAAKAKAANDKIKAEWKSMGESPAYISATQAALQAQMQGIKSSLEITKEGLKLKEAANLEAYQTGLVAEQDFIAQKQRLEKEALLATVASLEKEKTATDAAYRKQIGTVLPGKTQDRNKLIAEQKKEDARIEGEIQKTKIDLQIQEKVNILDLIAQNKELASVTREGQLVNLEATVKAQNALNALRITKGDMQTTEATRQEAEGQLRLLSLKKQNLEIDRAKGGLTAAHKQKLDDDINALNKQIDVEKILYAEKERRAALEKSTLGAMDLGMQDWAAKAKDQAKQIEEAVGRTFDRMTDALTEFVTTGKTSFSDLINSIIKDIIRMQIQQGIAGLSSGVSFTGRLSAVGALFHTGGVGTESTSYRVVPSAAFANAPRYHTGIGPGEKAAIIQDDEGVFTAGQMKAMGLIAGQSQQQQTIRVELVNQSGTPLQSTKSETKINGQEYIVTVLLDAVNRNAYGAKTGMRAALSSGGK